MEPAWNPRPWGKIQFTVIHFLYIINSNGIVHILSSSSYDSVVHMGIGNGGVTPLDVVGNSSNTPEWVSYQASEYGYTTMRINTNMLEIKYWNNHSVAHHTALLQREFPRLIL